LSPGFAITGNRSCASAPSRSAARSMATDAGTGTPTRAAVARVTDLSRIRCTMRGGGDPTAQNAESSSYAAQTIWSDVSLVGTTNAARSASARRTSCPADSFASPSSCTRPAMARDDVCSGCPLGAATMERTPARRSDRAMVTTFRTSAPTMITVGGRSLATRADDCGVGPALCTSAGGRRADLLLEDVRIDEELARPVQIFELAVFAVHRERALHSAANLGCPGDADARADVCVRLARRIAKLRIARDLIEHQPTVRELYGSRETRPLRRA